VRRLFDIDEVSIEKSEEEWRKGLSATPFFTAYLRSYAVPEPIVYMNVRGKMMATASKTMALVHTSPLGRKIEQMRFKPVESHELLEGYIFVDEDPACFELLLNYLRLCRMGFRMRTPLPPHGKHEVFKQLVEDLGLAGILG